MPIKQSTNLASLIGHSFGDGDISRIQFTFTNKSIELLKDVSEKVDSLPVNNLRPIIVKKKGVTTLVFPSLIKDILSTFGAPISNKITKSTVIPSWIKEGNENIKKAFIQALFDDEGCVAVKSREIFLGLNKRVDLEENLDLFFKEIVRMLNDLGVEAVSVRKRLCTKGGANGDTLTETLAIYGIFNFMAFQRNIGFTHKRKHTLLNVMIRNTQVLKLRKGEMKSKIIELLKEDPGITIKDLSNNLGISDKTIWDHLIDLKKSSLVTRDDDFPFKWFSIHK